MTTDLHPGDIDVVAARIVPTAADHARLIAVVGDQHVAGQRAVERKSVDLHDRSIMAVPDAL